MTGDVGLRLFYRIKPLVPRRVQVALRRVRARRIMKRIGSERIRPSGEGPPPGFSWPGGARSAVMLTHDVESEAGLAAIPDLLEVEREEGVRSCWNLVAGKYPVPLELVDGLVREGHEVGVHGLLHDGRLFQSREMFASRMVEIARAAESWGAIGFRSPSLLYDLELLSSLPFQWDSSVPAWDPFQPQPGGSGRYHPYIIGPACVEYPVTMWQDFTLFEELGRRDIGIWKEQALAIHGIGGLISVIVHPDYMTEERLDLYRELLRFLRTLAPHYLLPGSDLKSM